MSREGDEPVGKYEKHRYRVILWFDASPNEVERYAEALSRVWDEHSGITSQQTQLAELEQSYRILAEPIKPATLGTET